MTLEEQFSQLALEVLPHFIALSLIAGFFGALICVLLFNFLSKLEEKLLSKAKAKRWAKAQADKQAALSCGDDAAGRACETGGGSAA